LDHIQIQSKYMHLALTAMATIHTGSRTQ